MLIPKCWRFANNVQMQKKTNMHFHLNLDLDEDTGEA